MAKAVKISASRSLGLLKSKCKSNGGFQYFTFTKLFPSLVGLFLNMMLPLWGTKDLSCINSVKNRAMGFFVGVRKYTPNLSLYDDMGWTTEERTTNGLMARLDPNEGGITSLCDLLSGY